MRSLAKSATLSSPTYVSSAVRTLDYSRIDFLVKVATESWFVARIIKQTIPEMNETGLRWVDPCGYYTKAELELVLAHLIVQGVPT